MSADSWTCPSCGLKLSVQEPVCRVCRVTQINRNVIGRIQTPERSARPPPEPVEVRYPYTIREARFNLPLAGGSLWSSGVLVAVQQGLFMVSEKDALDTAALAARPPAAGGPVGPTSIFVPSIQIERAVHNKLVGQFLELKNKQKIPLRLAPSGWEELDLVCDSLGIAHS